MTTLYIRHPARAGVDGAGSVVPCQFALVGDGGALLQQGAAALGSLTDLTGAARRVVLLLAAADVTLLRVKIPPLSSARLKAALPNLVEELILGDATDCVLAASPAAGADGLRTVAVVQRAWLEVLARALLAQGARSISALPAQLCLPLPLPLPLPAAGAVAAISAGESGLELTLRLGQHEGVGLSVAAQPAAALHTLRALAPDVPLTVYVAASELADWQALATGMPGISIEADHWAHWVAASRTATPDLIPALGAAGAQARDWRRWRWPLRLALAALLVNLAGMNIEWMHLKREAAAMRLGMLQTFKAAYPKESVILDPQAQMRKNLALARQDSGQPGADEFTALCAAFGEAMRSLPRPSALASLEYRERSLFVKFKGDSPDAAAAAQLRAALAARNLLLSESTPGAWQIRSAAATTANIATTVTTATTGKP